MIDKILNTGPVGLREMQKDINPKTQSNNSGVRLPQEEIPKLFPGLPVGVVSRPPIVGQEFLDLINRQLDIIEVKDARITELTNLLIRQDNINMIQNEPNQSLESGELVTNKRWNRIKQQLERKYAKVRESPKPEKDYTTAAENAAQELGLNNNIDSEVK